MYTSKESDDIKYSEPSLYDDKVSAAPATDVKNIRYPEILLLEKNGINGDISQKATENCFKPDTKVILETGKAVPMSSIVVGDKVCVGSKNGILEFSEIYLISHCDLEAETEYQKIEFTMPTGLTESILLTPDHHILTNVYFDYAKNVQPYSTQLKVLSGNHMVHVRVASVCTETHNGYIAPFTRTGTIIADNVMCSCYSTCAPYQETIHAMLTPLRLTTWFKKSTHTGKEIHPYLRFLYNRYKDVNNVYEGLGKLKIG